MLKVLGKGGAFFKKAPPPRKNLSCVKAFYAGFIVDKIRLL
jgi:hypothetical protein